MQKNWSNLIYFFFLVVLGICVYQFKLINKLKTSLHETVQMYVSCSNEYEDLEYNNRLLDSLEFISQGYALNNIYTKNIETSSKEKLSDIIVNPKIIMYFDQYNCTSCYKSNFVEFNKMINLYGAENFIFLGKFESLNEIKNFINYNEIKCKSFIIENSEIELPMIKGNTPFIFFTDNSLKVQDNFFISTKSPESNSNYIKHIFEKHHYFKFKK